MLYVYDLKFYFTLENIRMKRNNCLLKINNKMFVSKFT